MLVLYLQDTALVQVGHKVRIAIVYSSNIYIGTISNTTYTIIQLN
jgi:hypothetical protein